MLADLRILTFNLLAPVYKRIPNGPHGGRESDDVAAYTARHLALIQLILDCGADVICLQEFWFHPSLKNLYEDRLGSKYDFYYLQRTGNKPDGLATLTSHHSLVVADTQELHISADRVALLLRLTLTAAQREETVLHGSSFLLVNTHLSFNHGGLWDERVRNSQVRKLTAQVDEYVGRCHLADAPVLLAGDFNGSDDAVVQHLVARGFASLFERVGGREGAPITHLTHRNEEMQADYIFLHPGRGSHRQTVCSTRPLYRHQFHNASEELETEGLGGGSVGVCEMAGGLSIRPKKCLILPKHLSADRWPRSEFVISDHRPLLGIYQVERHAIMSN